MSIRSQRRARAHDRSLAAGGNCGGAIMCGGQWYGRASPIGEATDSSVTTVDQADMRALVSRQTVVRHGAASL